MWNVDVELHQSYFSGHEGTFWKKKKSKYVKINFCNSEVYSIPEVLFNETPSINYSQEAKQMFMEPPRVLELCWTLTFKEDCCLDSADLWETQKPQLQTEEALCLTLLSCSLNLYAKPKAEETNITAVKLKLSIKNGWFEVVLHLHLDNGQDMNRWYPLTAHSCSILLSSSNQFSQASIFFIHLFKLDEIKLNVAQFWNIMPNEFKTWTGCSVAPTCPVNNPGMPTPLPTYWPALD